jgi:mRNA interferase MazF
VKQYEIRWANLGAPAGRRPVLLLTRTEGSRYLSKLIVVEITTTIRGIPQEIVLGRREGLGGSCVANFDNLHVVNKTSLGDALGRLATSREVEAKRALGYALGWPELKSL